MSVQYYLKKNIKIAGKSTNGFSVLKGCFKLTSTIGLPLEDMFTILYNKNCLIDWVDFIEDDNFDWNIESLLIKIDNLAMDRKYKNTVKLKILKHIENRE